MSWKDILKERILDRDPPIEYQPDYDARSRMERNPDEDLYDALRRNGFNDRFINEIKRMKELEKDETKFNQVLNELDELAEMFDHREALRQIGEPDHQIFYDLGYHTIEGRKKIKEQGSEILSNYIYDALSGD